PPVVRFGRFWIQVVEGDRVGHLVFESIDHRRLRATQASGAGHDCVEDGLHISRRARNHPEDVARRGLLLLRLRQTTLQVRKRQRWRHTSGGRLECCSALGTELMTGGILVLAPGTLHAEPPVNRSRAYGRTKVARRGDGVNFALLDYL